jgi:hypothetical protein
MLRTAPTFGSGSGRARTHGVFGGDRQVLITWSSPSVTTCVVRVVTLGIVEAMRDAIVKKSPDRVDRQLVMTQEDRVSRPTNPS